MPRISLIHRPTHSRTPVTLPASQVSIRNIKNMFGLRENNFFLADGDNNITFPDDNGKFTDLSGDIVYNVSYQIENDNKKSFSK